jgi:predicted RNA binding protein YcfA (HicA-like mRNA interferase family)
LQKIDSGQVHIGIYSMMFKNRIFRYIDMKKNKQKGRRIRRVFRVRDVIKALLLNGWVMNPQMQGDHRQFHCDGNPYVITIAGHLNDEIPRGTLGCIQRVSGLRFCEIIVW